MTLDLHRLPTREVTSAVSSGDNSSVSLYRHRPRVQPPNGRIRVPATTLPGLLLNIDPFRLGASASGLYRDATTLLCSFELHRPRDRLRGGLGLGRRQLFHVF